MTTVDQCSPMRSSPSPSPARHPHCGGAVPVAAPRPEGRTDPGVLLEGGEMTEPEVGVVIVYFY